MTDPVHSARNAALIEYGLTNTLENPAYVEKGNRPGTYVYVDPASTNVSGDPLRVPVKLITGTSALLKTAFFAGTETAPEIVWTRGSTGND